MTALPPAPVGPTIVIVEDDSDLLHALRFAFELEGWSVITYSTAEALLTGEPLPNTGCLVFDQVLPGTSGLDLLSQLRTRGTALPAIIITTHPSAKIRLSALQSRANIVEKPLLGSALTEAIRQALTSQAS